MNTRTSFGCGSLGAALTIVTVGIVAVGIAAAPAIARSLPALDRRIVDEGGVLAPAARDRLDATLADYERRTGHQFAVVILGSLDGEVLEQLSLRAAEQWRLGDKRRDDGLLVVMAMQERAARIEVGYGLEGVVTDAFASRVIRDTMAPRFAQGDVAGGLEAGLSALMQAAAGESVGVGPSGAGSTAREAPSLTQLSPVIMFVFVVIVTGLARRRGGQGRGDGGGGILALGILMSALGGGRHGGGGGGGFSGGGGGFGGGGASGRW